MMIKENKDEQFLSISDDERSSWEKAKYVVLPIPYEETVSYGGGTANGPASILEASQQVELFDEETVSEAYKSGIFTASPVDFKKATGEAAFDLIYKYTKEIIDAGKFPLGLGGEHSVSSGEVKAVFEKYPDLYVVHLDAHSDMRSEFGGTKWSHASVMRRIHEMGIPYTSIGIRAMGAEEYEYIKSDLSRYFFAHHVRDSVGWIDDALATIKGPVFLTLDVDVFDSGYLPHTGTPEPGGLSWHQVALFLKNLCKEKRVVGADIVELVSDSTSRPSDFMVARLAYKLISYIEAGK